MVFPVCSLLLPQAQSYLTQLNQFTTPLEKMYCFSHTIRSLTSAALDITVSADELLPILVYLVIVTDIPNWTGNLLYINRFHFSNVSFEEFTYVCLFVGGGLFTWCCALFVFVFLGLSSSRVRGQSP